MEFMLAGFLNAIPKMISIITINFNNKVGLENTIKSVVGQTCKDYEYIVIDGGSTDGSVEVIKKYANKITYWVSERDRGIYHAMNKGIAVAHGEYCNFMNSGDCFYEDHTLGKLVPYLTDADVVYGTALSSNSKVLYDNKAYPDLHFFFEGTLSHQATFIKTTLMSKYKYDEELKIVSDFKFFLQVFIKDNCSFKRVDEIICLYDEGGISSTNKTLLKKERRQVLETMFPRIINTFDEYYKDDLEQNLYQEIRHSKYHKYIYMMNVFELRILSLLKANACWVRKYPLKLK